MGALGSQAFERADRMALGPPKRSGRITSIRWSTSGMWKRRPRRSGVRAGAPVPCIPAPQTGSTLQERIRLNDELVFAQGHASYLTQAVVVMLKAHFQEVLVCTATKTGGRDTQGATSLLRSEALLQNVGNQHRSIRRSEEGFTWEADPKYAKQIVQRSRGREKGEEFWRTRFAKQGCQVLLTLYRSQDRPTTRSMRCLGSCLDCQSPPLSMS